VLFQCVDQRAQNKVSHDPAAIETLFVEVFLEAHRRPPAQIILDLDATDPLRGDPTRARREPNQSR
jgi:hypothetical protein